MPESDLKNLGIKLTRPRQAIYKVLTQNQKPLSAQEIHRKLNGRFDLASVYRNLNLLAGRGLIYSEVLGQESCFYLADLPHHHIICRSCGRLECLPCRHQIKVKHFRVIKHRLTLSGLCDQCFFKINH